MAWKFLADLLFPINCLGCKRSGSFICTDCLNEIPLTTIQNTNTIIASYYDYPLLKKAIWHFKYDFVRDLKKPLAQLLVKKLQIINNSNPLLVPVPLHIRRLRWRGFNQSAELAQEVSKSLKFPMAQDLLIKTKNNPPQAQIKDSTNRMANIQNSFQINPKYHNLNFLKNYTIILVDDIITTQATLKECENTLKQAGAKKILKLVLAQG